MKNWILVFVGMILLTSVSRADGASPSTMECVDGYSRILLKRDVLRLDDGTEQPSFHIEVQMPFHVFLDNVGINQAPFNFKFSPSSSSATSQTATLSFDLLQNGCTTRVVDQIWLVDCNKGGMARKVKIQAFQGNSRISAQTDTLDMRVNFRWVAQQTVRGIENAVVGPIMEFMRSDRPGHGLTTGELSPVWIQTEKCVLE